MGKGNTFSPVERVTRSSMRPTYLHALGIVGCVVTMSFEWKGSQWMVRVGHVQRGQGWQIDELESVVDQGFVLYDLLHGRYEAKVGPCIVV